MALRGLKVLELAGLAPAPMCGMILADFGADVTLINRVNATIDLDCLANGKRSVALNLKTPEGAAILKKLTKQSDVLLEPFRKGVMESMGLGPNELLNQNPRLIYARLTGFGHNGKYARMAGHDINYVAMSGTLSMLGRAGNKPTFPANLLADFGGGGLTCALGIAMALYERSSSGKGQVVDCAMVEGTAYLSSWLFRSQKLPIWGQPRGENILDTGSHFYDTYETKDGKFLAVGALESHFFEILLEKLQLAEQDIQHFGNFEENKKIFTEKFKEKTSAEWCAIFDGSDACVTPVLSPQEAVTHPHNVSRKVFAESADGVVPNPAPKLSRTPAVCSGQLPVSRNGAHTVETLLDLGYTRDQIEDLRDNNVIEIAENVSKL